MRRESKLPIEKREEAIRLYVEENMSQTEIAKKLELSRNTVKSWIRRYVQKKIPIKISNEIRKDKKAVQKEVRAKKIITHIRETDRERYQEKRIKELEMKVELIEDFILEEERRRIKK